MSIDLTFTLCPLLKDSIAGGRIDGVGEFLTTLESAA